MKPRCATKGSPKHNRLESLFNTVTKVVTENAGDTRGQSSRSQIRVRGGARSGKILAPPSPRWRPVSPCVRALSPATPLRRRPMVRVTDGSFSSAAHGGAKIFSRAWCPEGAAPPRAVLVWSHGIHEHLGRFERLYARLAEAGVATHAWDHVGHGRSESAGGGKRHQFPSGFDAVVADAVQTRGASARRTERAVVRGPPSSFRSHHFSSSQKDDTAVVARRTRVRPRTLSSLPSDLSPPNPPHTDKPLPPSPHIISSTTHSSVRRSTPSVPLGGASLGGLVATTAALRVLATNELRVAGVGPAAPALDLEWTPALRLQAGQPRRRPRRPPSGSRRRGAARSTRRTRS